ncbi:AAA family ATPase [Priestia filamentosa]|uniref:SF1B family DNA helicase RecD2 n=1 Tax=Priestia filamentosa TaxID=1402861 RepID=UPI00397D6E0C
MDIKEVKEAKVTKIIYRNEKNHYSILLARVDGQLETLIGYFPIVNEELHIHFFGKKEIGKNNREQYKVESYSILLPTTKLGLFNFLVNDFVNINIETASIIIDKLGINYLKYYKDKNFIESSIGREYFQKKKTEFDDASFRIANIEDKLKLMKVMIKMGFPNDISSKVAFSDFKISSESVVENPYQLIQPFELDFYKIDRIALNNGMKPTDNTRITEGICYVLEEGANKFSHIYLPYDELIYKLNRLLKLSLTKEEVKPYRVFLEEEKRIVSDIYLNIYSYKYYNAEVQLSLDLYRLRDGKKEPSSFVNKAIKELETDVIKYSPEQVEAIKLALKEPLLIISGAAGTGKTTTLKKVVKLLEEHKNKGKKPTDKDYYKIALCAPTGKAAERMKEITGMEASTIHSLLNIHPLYKIPAYKETNFLDVDCLIVDESGMNDTLLFSYLLNAAKTNCKVIIVGDENQLPSLGPGNVLEELLNSTEFISVKLLRVYRQGADSEVLDLSDAIKKGNIDISHILNKKSNNLSFIDQHNPNIILKTIEDIMEILLNKSSLDLYKDVQVVTPIHNGLLGTIELNNRIQQLMNLKRKRKKLSIGDKDFYIDDKVIHTKNNADKKVYNGEVGRVVKILNKILTVRFTSGKEVEYTGEELFELELGFALSVHKMQGSEAMIVVAPMHSILGNMIQRRLLYTLVTRAKKKLIMLGQREVLIKGIQRDTSDKRNCSLAARLEDNKFHYLVDKSK